MNNRDVISICKNFHDIINFEAIEGDDMTPKMVKIYKKYIFSVKNVTKESIENMKNLDKAMKKYIDDYFFRKDLQSCVKKIKIKCKEINEAMEILIDKIIDFFVNYNIYTTRIIYISRWI